MVCGSTYGTSWSAVIGFKNMIIGPQIMIPPYGLWFRRRVRGNNYRSQLVTQKFL